MKKTYFIILSIFLIAGFSCSTEKNTPITRTYHNITAHYNVYFNGQESFKAANKKIDEQYKDDFTQLLPVFKYSEDEAAQLVSSDMERTLSKMGKTIAVHSITVKPKIKGDLTPKDKAFLKKNEYCKWIDDAYLLMGKANLYKKEYSKALRSFRRILNLYKTENTRFEAELWIAKVYIEQEKYKDAFNYLSELENDVRHPKNLDKQINLSFTAYYIAKEDYENAIIRLKKAIELTKKRKKKGRLYYLLAQLEHLNGNNNMASEYFKKVTKISRNYDMTFSAKIMRATVFAKGQNSEEIKKQLRKMLKDEKNEEYKDQIYYALATIEQKEGNINEALKNYKKSAQVSVANYNQKAISFLAIADIYFERKDFLNAGQYYDSTMQYLNTDYNNYNQISKKAENTGMLVQYLGEVQRQDSLQRVAKMPKKKRLALIDSIIQEVIAEEKRQQQMMNNTNYYDPLDFNNQNQNQQQGGKWYMYNPVLISRGQNEFKKKWGKRKLEDNWRRKNKSVINPENTNENTEVKDSTKVTDKKTREYYLQNLPLNDSLMKISDSIIMVSLFNGAEVYERRFNENKSAIKTYEKLISQYPNNNFKLETYYRLYNLYNETGNNNKADYYKKLIISKYPKSKYAKILQDPNYLDKLLETEKKALKLYDKTLKKYQNFNYRQTINLANKGISEYPESQAYPNFLFLKAKSYGSLNQKDSLKHYLTIIVDNFPKTDIGILSNDILNLMNDSRYNYDIYKHIPEQKHFFVVVIDDKENNTAFRFKLKTQAELFTNTKKFSIANENFDTENSLVTVKTFDDEKEAQDFYYSILESDVFKNIEQEKYYTFFISKSNYEKFLNDKILEKYRMFFNKTYSLQLQ